MIYSDLGVEGVRKKPKILRFHSLLSRLSHTRERFAQTLVDACRSEKVGLFRKPPILLPSPSALLCLPFSSTGAAKRPKVMERRRRIAIVWTWPWRPWAGRPPPVIHFPDPASQTAAAASSCRLLGAAAAGRARPGRGRSQCPRHQLQHCENGAARLGGRRRAASAPAPRPDTVCPSAQARRPPTPAWPRPGPSPVSPMMMYLKR